MSVKKIQRGELIFNAARVILLILLLLITGFQRAAANPYNGGPGGPVLIVTDESNPFSEYYAEILLTEGMNHFALTNLSAVTADILTNYQVVILGDFSVSAGQVTMLSNWVHAGGNLIAMRPDKQLAGLLGLEDAAATLSEGYLLVDTATRPGVGIVGQTIQFHGVADLYALAGATSVATLYSNASLATGYPAVTLRSVGSNGGHAAAFMYDLARSVVYTRQGNPEWVGQERDGIPPLRAGDLFFGGAENDPQPDWINLSKVDIPQADEQQRLLVNLMIEMNGSRNRLPRFWYFPHGYKAAVVLTGDDHAAGGTAGRFEEHLTHSSSEGSVDDWGAIRSTSYLFTNSPLTDAEAAAYQAAGFELGLHLNTGCTNYTPETLDSFFSEQLAAWQSQYPSLAPPTTHRIHCIAWSDYTTLPEIGLAHGIRLDVSYYYFPGTWAADWPGLFTGSGMAMRFARTNGAVIDVFQAVTQMTDESNQVYPYTIDALLGRAIGPLGYYGTFVANIHTDVTGQPTSGISDAIITSAQRHGVPVISARQLLQWLDARNASTIHSLLWSNNTQFFSVAVDPNARGLQVMMPIPDGYVAASALFNGSPTVFSNAVIKGINYAILPANSGNYEVECIPDVIPPSISTVTPGDETVNVSVGTEIVIQFSEAMAYGSLNTNNLQLRNSADELVSVSITYDPSKFTASLSGGPLVLGETYTAIVKGGIDGVKDFAGNSLETDYTWSFTTEEQVPVSIWKVTDTPAIISASDDNAVELGLKFRSAIDGKVTAIRFYKAAENIGPHVGNLWTANGELLASVTFENETSSGWQQQPLPAPVSITSNTTYIVSYHAPNGRYSVNGAYFASQGVGNYPLRALADGEDGGNSVAIYGESAFPTTSYNAANYWVDVVFYSDLLPDEAPPSVSDVNPPLGTTDVNPATKIVVVFSESMLPESINENTIQLRDAANTLVLADVFYDTGNFRAILSPITPLALSNTYTVTVRGGPEGVTDASTNAMLADYVWSFSTLESWSLWPEDATPEVDTANDPLAVTLGLKFQTAVAGQVTGIRYYRGADNPGPHEGALWTASGELLAHVVFTNETSSGWQQQLLTNPVVIAPNTTYIVSYHAPNGGYSVSFNYFTAGGFTNGPLRALGSVEAGGNGVAAYGTPSVFPDLTFFDANYWVDVVFVEGLPPDDTPPQVVATIPANEEAFVGIENAIIASFNEDIDVSSIGTNTFVLRDIFGAAVPANVSYDTETRTARLEPLEYLKLGMIYSVTIMGGETGVTDLSGNRLEENYQWTFVTRETLATGLWDESEPDLYMVYEDSFASTNGVELGVKFRSSVPARLTGIRFYKSSNGLSEHKGNVWDASGNLLASVPFSAETASGWQYQSLPQSVEISPDTTYVVSYYSEPSAFVEYVFSSDYFESSLTNYPLRTLANGEDGGNGVFSYGPSSFPTNSVGNNYWVDPVLEWNQPPIVVNPIPDQEAIYGELFEFAFSADAFTDPDSNSLSYVTIGLPAMIEFEPQTRSFTGVLSQVGNFEISVIATDSGVPAMSVTNRFTLSVAKAPAQIVLNDLVQTYDGTARVVTATTTPEGLNVSFTYNGELAAPTNAGSYEVVGTVVEGNYVGSVTNTLTVHPAEAVVVLNDLVQTYDGTARVVTATTTPEGLNVSFTYNGELAAPTNAGVYTVVGAIVDANYVGSATNTLVVSRAAATIILNNLTQTYDGTARVVDATTVPPGINVTLTYNGSPNAPTNAGSYQVVGVVDEDLYVGIITNTLVVNKAIAEVTLNNLAQVYDGTARVVSATTEPAGLTVVITYNGELAAPTNAGSYEVVGTVVEGNYVGSVTNTLIVIAPVPVLSIAPVGSSQVALGWNSAPNQVYQLQVATNISSGEWMPIVPNVIATGTFTTVTNTPDVGTLQRFYRVMVIAP